MSQTIDSRVVEMKFDNKNFEKNVAESMKTLDALSKRVDKLEETQVDFGKIQKAADSFDLSKMDKALDSITHRFSIMGQVGASVISNITTDAYNMVKGFSSKVWDTVFGQMKTGGKARASNVENAKFLLEGMGITYGKEVEDQISDAVSETAFGFDEAAMAMAQLSGASVQLGDDMDKALKGISGVAAMTNRSFSDIADIFVDAAATGKVSADTFNRLSERGLAAKGIMQEFYGVNAEQLNELAKAGQISFNDFSKAMYDAFGKQAKKSNETLNGVLANTRAVLSRMGQSFYQPLMANSSDVVKFFQQLKDTLKGFEAPVKEIGKQLSGYVLNLARFGTDFLKKIDVTKYEPVFKNISSMFENLYFAAQNLYSNILKPFGKVFKDALFEVFPSLNTGKGLLETISIKLKEASENFRKFTSEIGLFGEKGASVKEVLVSIFNALKTGATVLKGAITLFKAAAIVFANFLKTINAGGILKGLTGGIASVVQIGYWIIAGIATGLTGGFPLLLSAVAEVGKMIVSAFCAFFGISSPSKKMRDDVGYWLVAGIAEGMKKALAAGLITTAIALVIGLILTQLREGEESITATASRLFDGFIDKIAGVIDRISKWAGNTGLGKAVGSFFNIITISFNKLSEGIQKFNAEKFGEIIGAVKQLVVLGGFTYIVIQFAAASTMFTTALWNISRAAKFYMNSMQLKYFGATLKNLAITIGVISASILLFAGMVKSGDWSVLLIGLGTVAVIVTGLVIAVKQLQGAIKSENLDPHGIIKIEAMFMGLATAVFLIASSVKKIGRLNWKQILTGIGGIIGVVIAMGGIVIAMQKFTEGSFQMEKSWMVIVAIGATVRLIAGAIKSISKLDPKDAWEATKMISIIVGLLGAISILTQVFSKLKSGQLVDNITNINLPAMFLALGASIILIAKAVKMVSEIKPEDLEQGKKVMYQIMAWLGVMLAIGYFTAQSMGAFLAGLGGALVGIAAAVKLIGEMESGVREGFRALLNIMTLVAIFIGAVNLINKATGGYGDSSGTKALLYAGICIAAMGAVVRITGSMSISQIFKGIMVISALSFFVMAIGMLFGLTTSKNGNNGNRIGMKQSFFETMKGKADKLSNTVKTIWVVRSIVSSLVKLALAVVVMSKVIKSTDELSLAITTLAGIMGVMTILLVTAGAVSKEFPDVNKITKPIVALTGAILVIAGAMVILGTMPNYDSMKLAAVAIGGVLLAMAVVLDKSKVFGVQGMNVKGILACAVAIIAISAALTLLVAAIGKPETIKEYGPLAAAVMAIGLVLLAIGGAMKLADKTKISTKSATGFLIATLSLVSIAGAVILLAAFTDDMVEAGTCAVLLGGALIAMAGALKIGEKIKFQTAAALLVGSLSVVAIAGAIAGLAYLVGDLQEAEHAAIILSNVILALGMVLAGLTAISAATGGVGAGVILAIAGAIGIMGVAMAAAAVGIWIGVEALGNLFDILTEENANKVTTFFKTLGDGIGEAGVHIGAGIKAAIIAIKDGLSVLKSETSSAGFDFVSGFVDGIKKFSPLAGVAAVALGALAVFGLRSKEGIDAHSDSRKTIAAAIDFIGGFIHTLSDNTDAATEPAAEMGAAAVDSLQTSVQNGTAGLTGIWDGIKAAFGEWNLNDIVKSLNPLTGGIFGAVLKTGSEGALKGYGASAVEEVKAGAEEAAQNGGGFAGILQSFFTGSFDNLLEKFDWSKILGEGGILDLKNFLGDAGASMDALSGDNIPKLIDRLKEAGLAGDDLINALKELGITQEQLESLGLAEALGLTEAKEGAEDVKETLESLADEIIAGKFGNAPERWDKMFEHLVQSGKTAEEAYAAIADSQNEVNKRLGSSVVHTAEEMEKKVSESVKKATKAVADANAEAKKAAEKKSVKYGTKEYDEETAKTGQTINTTPTKKTVLGVNTVAPSDTAKLNNEKNITAEKEKQVSLAEKEAAVAALNANKIKADNAALTDEKRKQIEAENAQYQKVVDTYNKQQDMVKAIQDQEAATKKAEEAEKKRGDAIKASAGAVVYGTDEYYKQTGKTGMTINTMPTKKTEAAPVKTETKVEVEPVLNVKKPDVTQLKKEVVDTVEKEAKDLQAKLEVTPKIDTTQAEQSIAQFKQKTQELKTSIPETFNGIAAEVSKHLSTIASKISQEGTKITNNTKTVFQNAVSAAVTILNGNETITKFTNAGKAAGEGYANGIKSKIDAVRSAGATLGNTAIKATKAATKTNSPSKIFTQLGERNGIGYGNGMLDSIKYVADASSQMATASIDEITRIVDAVQSSINEGFDIEPTIVPVMDTSGIQNDLDWVNASFGQQQAMDILADIDATKAFRNQETENMQSQMDSLRGDLSVLSDAILNQPTPVVEANVNLMGDADGVFKLVQNSNNRYTKMHGKSAFA